MSLTNKYEERAMSDLEVDEYIITIVGGRTAPTNWVMKLFPEISWLTKDNMPIVFVLTNQRIRVYMLHLDSEITLAMSFRREDIKDCIEANGPLNGAIRLTLKDSQTFTFVLKKDCVPEIVLELQE
ncbi:hypothetical protein QNH20_10055 [Neobacillus sp. WH10]|uniref:hypothetical protein n=1 Tax=Neobacillus sp. WH10 TaxID=3047873 RepID=UPI0024C13E90|nr:hypothetical protein [Neobacillus sp. WH10]WHY79452.1 hypothetical protein QNH20_10055 [Neobacillus sp. WH10]